MKLARALRVKGQEPRVTITKIHMKKLSVITILCSLLFGGVSFADDHRPQRDGERHRLGFRIPKILQDDAALQESAEEYRAARQAFLEIVRGLRSQMEGATDEEKEALRTQIRGHMKEHRQAQREFRREVRAAIKLLREAREAG